MNDLKYYKGTCYRFFDFVGAENTISTAELRLTRMDKLNDPFEAHEDKYLPAMREQQLRKMAAQEFPNSIAKQRKYASQHRSESKAIISNLDIDNIAWRTYTCSFSKNYEDENSYLLWSHYANNHKGICIGFSFEGHLGFNPYDVEYPKMLEVLNLYDLQTDGLIRDDQVEKFLKITLFQKHNCWRNENEVRLAFTERMLKDKEFNFRYRFEDDRKYLKLSLQKEMISTIIFGLSTAPNYREKIMLDVKDHFPNIKFKEMYHTNKLELNSRDI